MWSSLMRELPPCNEMHLRLEKINKLLVIQHIFKSFSAAAGSRCASYAASKHALQVPFNNSISILI